MPSFFSQFNIPGNLEFRLPKIKAQKKLGVGVGLIIPIQIIYSFFADNALLSGFLSESKVCVYQGKGAVSAFEPLFKTLQHIFLSCINLQIL